MYILCLGASHESLQPIDVAFIRHEKWFEETVPHLGGHNFKQSFRVNPSTFRFLVESLRHVLEKQVTNMRDPITAEKRVAIGLYKLCSSAEDRTVANLFGVGRSSVNVIYREFCAAVVSVLESDWIRMITEEEMLGTSKSSKPCAISLKLSVPLMLPFPYFASKEVRHRLLQLQGLVSGHDLTYFM